MKQKKTLADFKEEWEAINRRLRILNPNYEAMRAVMVGDDTWFVCANMNIRIAAQPQVHALTPENYKPTVLTDAEGKPLEPSVPAEVQAVLDKMNEEMKAFLEGGVTFPEGDFVQTLSIVKHTPEQHPEVSHDAV